MRNVPLDSVDGVSRPVLAIGTDYPSDTLLEAHTHRRAQLLYGMSGVMEVETDDGAWAIPPYSGVWIPAGKRHRVRMQGVSTRSLYIEPAAAPRPAEHCQALVVTPLLHQLLLASADIPALYDENGRDSALVQLLFHEIRLAKTMPPVCADPPRPTACAAVQGVPEIAQHPGDAPGVGAAAEQKPAHLHPILSATDRHEFRCLAPASLSTGGAAASVGRAARHAGGAGSRLRQPRRVFHHVQTAAWQSTDGLRPGIHHGDALVGA